MYNQYNSDINNQKPDIDITGRPFIPTIPITIDKQYITYCIIYCVVVLMLKSGLASDREVNTKALKALEIFMPLIYNIYYSVKMRQSHKKLTGSGYLITDILSAGASFIILYTLSSIKFKLIVTVVTVINFMIWVIITQIFGELTIRLMNRHDDKVLKQIEKQKSKWDKQRNINNKK
jgi:uncharacterized protein YacL